MLRANYDGNKVAQISSDTNRYRIPLYTRTHTHTHRMQTEKRAHAHALRWRTKGQLIYALISGAKCLTELSAGESLRGLAIDCVE